MFNLIFFKMKVEEQFQNGFEPLEEAQLVQQFQVEELEKRYEFAWIDSWSATASYTSSNGGTVSATVSGKF
jgi:hypothetical protein